MSEASIMRRIMVAASAAGARVFRNNVGLFDTKDGRKIRTGLCVGSSDLIGWTPVQVRPDMVGKKVAIFTALEVKAGRGSATKDQAAFIEAVKNAGGIAEVVRGEDQALDLLKSPPSGSE